jgi:hypothetical protein
MLDFGRSDDVARLHVLMRRNDLPIFDLLGDGAYFNQYPGWGSIGTVMLEYPTGGWRCSSWGSAFHGFGLTWCTSGRLIFGGTWVTGKPKENKQINKQNQPPPPEFYL